VTLDLVKVSRQVQHMGEQLRDSRTDRLARLDRARWLFRELAPQWGDLAEQARKSLIAAAAPREPLDAVHPRPPVPPAYEVLATDGSTIEPDRHGPAMCALVNVGRVRIRYGVDPSAALDSEPRLYFRSNELYLSQGGGARRLLSERLLDARRSVAEMAALAELGRKPANDLPRVALADGLLTIWRQDWAEADASAMEDELRRALDAIADSHLPLAAYVSNPHSHWVTDLLRQAAGCQAGPLSCLAGCQSGNSIGVDSASPPENPCALEGLVDVQLFEHLGIGTRSGVFEMVGRDQDRYGVRNRSNFFYLHVGSEVTRVEIPRWVAEDPLALDLVHAIICDQAERGQGYPTALARAHEQAVLTGQDRRAFEQLVIETLQRAGQRTGLSEKRISKNVRAV
jgi:NurA domain